MRIALLEDDLDQASLISYWLQQAGHSVEHHPDSDGFLRATHRDSFDLHLLDWVVPGQKSGIDVLSELKKVRHDSRPVLFVTARDDERSVVKALDAGADDYMAKPLRHLELIARVNAIARRAGYQNDQNQKLEAEPYCIDPAKSTVALHDKIIPLTTREFELVLFLFRRAGQLVSRRHIMESVWGVHGRDVQTRTVDTHISRLRRKLAINEANGWVLSSIYQHGYRLEAVDSDPQKT